jgi:hypothetical protein
MIYESQDRRTIAALSDLTSKGKCWVNLEQSGAIRVLFDPSHPLAKRGYARVGAGGVVYSRDETGTEQPWAKFERERGPQPSATPYHNHGKARCTADTCF